VGPRRDARGRSRRARQHRHEPLRRRHALVQSRRPPWAAPSSRMATCCSWC
jgi:hypothetical protein